VECDRSSLVAGFIGQTAIKTSAKIKEAIGGILFIDEAYSLFKDSNGQSEDFGMEAIECLLKAMEDHRDQLVVVFAGYTDEMNKFFESNPGLKSRISNILNFEDYTKKELAKIAISLLNQKKLQINEPALIKLINSIDKTRSLSDFANVRTLRNSLEKTYKKQASRLIGLKRSGSIITQKQLNEILEEDIEN
jgi:hypothetical protein